MLRALTLACLLAACVAEFYSSVNELQKLLSTESLLLKTLESHIAARDAKTNELRSLLNKFAREHNIELRNVSPHADADLAVDADADVDALLTGGRLANPIAAFRLVKRLASDWRRAQTDLAAVEPAAPGLVDLAGRADLVLPSDEDLETAAAAMMRLQDMYRLDAESLARGEVNGVRYAGELTSEECFELGRREFNAGHFHDAEPWMLEALARHDGDAAQNLTDILGYIAFSRYKQGRYHEALQLTEEMLALEPDNGLALRNLAGYQELSAATPPGQEMHLPRVPHGNANEETYKKICRGDARVDLAAQARLRCRFVDHGSWFLRLARLKEEEMHLDPRIMLYHDVISDAEIEAVTSMARTKLIPATVISENKTEVLSSRIARNCWVMPWEVPEVEAVDRRAGHLTGLTLDTSESLQVTNYHVGGHFQPHWDYLSADRLARDTAFNAENGNRIATVMYYMSDVELGGATVFTSLELALRPVRGAAAVWFNLHADGQGDPRTMHAGCPVLVGNKWIANKWFHEGGQEFRRPCAPDAKSTP